MPTGFKFRRIIGTGGGGIVALGRRIATGELVAIKRLRQSPFSSAKQSLRFKREMDLLQACSHTNLVRVIQSGVDKAGPWLALEYCLGGSLQDALQDQSRPINVATAVNAVVQVLNGLEYLHRVSLPTYSEANGFAVSLRGIVHRDIKPANILFADRERRIVKLADFGLARTFEAVGWSGITDPSAVGGSFEFMSRMQAIDFLGSGPAVDVWATAAVLFFCLTGEVPRELPPDADPVTCLQEHEVRSIRSVAEHVPAPIADILDTVLGADEYPSEFTAETFAAALSAALSECNNRSFRSQAA